MSGDRSRLTREAYSEYAEVYAAWSRGYGNFPGLREIADDFLELVGSDPRVILDAGSGAGRDASYFARKGHRLIALDICWEALRIWPETHMDATAIGRVNADMLQLPLTSQSCNAVWACAAVIHLEKIELRECLAEFHRVLVPGGVLCATFRASGATGWVASSPIPTERWVRTFDPAEFENLCDVTGFTRVEITPSGESNWFCLSARKRT